ncbi:MAG: hypothetical protein N4A72_08895 [Bacteroidales bacterium]|jgi:hypothetical protein|nr:hypothetical protein [Bacteroidales bacterium]
MKRVRYFRLDPTTETKEIGVWEQINVADYNKDTLLVKDLAYKSFPDSIPDFSGFKVNNGAKYTDVMSSFIPSQAIGVFVSERLKLIIEREKLFAGRFYAAQSIRDDYWFLHIIDRASEIVNFDKSEFINFLKKSKVEITPEHYSRLPKLVKPTKIVLNQDIDLFRSPYNVQILISERFKNIIEEYGITGTYIEEYNACEFFIE